MTAAKNLPETAVITEGEAFNAPTSTRPRSDSLVVSDAEGVDVEPQSAPEHRADDLAEQLSRMNSDFEDSLDTHRQQERQRQGIGGFAGLVCTASRTTAAVCAKVNDFAVRNPFKIALIGAGLAYALGRRYRPVALDDGKSVE